MAKTGDGLLLLYLRAYLEDYPRILGVSLSEMILQVCALLVIKMFSSSTNVCSLFKQQSDFDIFWILPDAN